ncbi:uncharacterized protein LOC132257472 [Phlebotomus argentipes]|uniref:uncharacterized protein LOC132257472 n=1 Tax=Phlebotomus argentipes TaxID=94469 RepID=UPI0028937F1E|nr:uncharacterized protein LOC132257472 [Phlebotomus argentipes]
MAHDQSSATNLLHLPLNLSLGERDKAAELSSLCAAATPQDLGDSGRSELEFQPPHNCTATSDWRQIPSQPKIPLEKLELIRNQGWKSTPGKHVLRDQTTTASGHSSLAFSPAARAKLQMRANSQAFPSLCRCQLNVCGCEI